MKIYETTNRLGYKSWQIVDRTSGVRKFRTFSDHRQAIQEAELIAGRIATGEAYAAQLNAQERASYGRAMDIIKPTGKPLELVASVYVEAYSVVGDRIVEAARFLKANDPSDLPDLTVSQVIDELLQARAGKSARYVADLRTRLGRFQKAFQCSLVSVTPKNVRTWLEGLKNDGKPLSGQSRLNFKRVVHTLYEFAIERGYARTNPAAGVGDIDVRRGEIEIYTPKEIAALLVNAQADYLPCLVLQAFCGVRSQECERLEWADVDMMRKILTIKPGKAKTARRRIVPIPDCAIEWLAPYSGKTGLIWPGTHRDFYAAGAENCERANVPRKDNALRHSWVSYRVAQTQNADQTALEAGNSRDMIFEHYRELVGPSDAAAWFSITPKMPANVTAYGRA